MRGEGQVPAYVCVQITEHLGHPPSGPAWRTAPIQTIPSRSTVAVEGPTLVPPDSDECLVDCHCLAACGTMGTEYSLLASSGLEEVPGESLSMGFRWNSMLGSSFARCRLYRNASSGFCSFFRVVERWFDLVCDGGCLLNQRRVPWTLVVEIVETTLAVECTRDQS